MFFYEKKLRILSFVLTIVMIILALPLSSIALDGEISAADDADTVEVAYEIIEEENRFQTGDRIVEIVERREENVKHFRLPDGSYEAVAYAKPVHRKNADGVWQDIDNALVENASYAK